MYLLLISLVVALMLKCISLMDKNQTINKEKASPFESGFSPFGAPRTPFSIQFFKILLLFLLFDIEIILVLPYPLFTFLEMPAIITCSLIILVLFWGLIFEWYEGSLNWL